MPGLGTLFTTKGGSLALRCGSWSGWPGSQQILSHFSVGSRHVERPYKQVLKPGLSTGLPVLGCLGSVTFSVDWNRLPIYYIVPVFEPVARMVQCCPGVSSGIPGVSSGILGVPNSTLLTCPSIPTGKTK